MTGLIPAIFDPRSTGAWMAGTIPAMALAIKHRVSTFR
jgi:hypothetical protein